MSQMRKNQSIFVYNVAKLIFYAYDVLKIELTAGEFYRTEEQQKIYLDNGLSKIKISQHQNRLAVDFNVFIDGKFRSDNEAYKGLAEYWKLLHPNNKAGYDWGWDANHFEMQ